MFYQPRRAKRSLSGVRLCTYARGTLRQGGVVRPLAHAILCYLKSFAPLQRVLLIDPTYDVVIVNGADKDETAGAGHAPLWAGDTSSDERARLSLGGGQG